MGHVDRRTLLALSGASAAALGAPALAQRRGGTDLNDPEANLRAYIRMRGDLSGKTVIERVEARSFGVIEHKLPVPLFAAVGIQVSRFLPTGAGFLFRYKYFSLTTDLATGKPIETLANPYTGRVNRIPPRTTAPGEILLTTKGWQFTQKPNDAATQALPGVVRPWSRMGDQLHLTDTLISPPKFEVHPAFQHFTYMADWTLATDGRRASVPASFAGTGMEDWRDWMEMDAKVHDGSLTVHMTGRKVAGRGDFPDWLIAAAAREMPTLFDTL
jgi:hypothetical protein